MSDEPTSRPPARAGNGKRDEPHTARQCPICRKPVDTSAESYPFCSQRCRLVDLGRWLDEKYRV